jgi:hypothetical protein
MTVTKQQQLRRMVRYIPKWNDAYLYAESMPQPSANVVAHRFTDNPSDGASFITRAEWYWERGKMQKRNEYEECAVMGSPKVAQAIIDAHNALKDRPDAAAIAEEWTKGAMAYMDSLTSSKPVVDNSWHECGELPPCGVPVELWFGGSFAYNCEFITRRGHHYVMWNLDADKPDCADYMNSQFRPLRTEREKAIDEMLDAAHQKGSFISKDACEIIYDAGYRKVKP